MHCSIRGLALPSLLFIFLLVSLALLQAAHVADHHGATVAHYVDYGRALLTLVAFLHVIAELVEKFIEHARLHNLVGLRRAKALACLFY